MSLKLRHLAVAGAAFGSMALAGPALAAETPAKADILFAIDTTPTMAPSIEQAKRNARDIVAGLRQTFPDAQFSVAEFRDVNYDDPSPDGPDDDNEHDYVLRQPMTADAAAFEAALGKLQVAPGDQTWRENAPESYNLVFNRSYTDAAINWRPDARLFVYVIGVGVA